MSILRAFGVHVPYRLGDPKPFPPAPWSSSTSSMAAAAAAPKFSFRGRTADVLCFRPRFFRGRVSEGVPQPKASESFSPMSPQELRSGASGPGAFRLCFVCGARKGSGSPLGRRVPRAPSTARGRGSCPPRACLGTLVGGRERAGRPPDPEFCSAAPCAHPEVAPRGPGPCGARAGLVSGNASLPYSFFIRMLDLSFRGPWRLRMHFRIVLSPSAKKPAEILIRDCVGPIGQSGECCPPDR